MAASAQPRAFNCIGAEQLEDDVFAIPFNRGGASITPAARANLDAAAELARLAPERSLCVLGHAAGEGGAESGRRLAARRARAVAAALAERGVERDRVRAEARVASFSRRAEVPEERSVTIVVLPAPAAPEADEAEEPAAPGPEGSR
jgi:outer membrane protein OmpA-like peptidoglycan-associated protein